jgi:hypothetical protein
LVQTGGETTGPTGERETETETETDRGRDKDRDRDRDKGERDREIQRQTAPTHRAQHLDAVAVSSVGPDRRRDRDKVVAKVHKDIDVVPVGDAEDAVVRLALCNTCMRVCERVWAGVCMRVCMCVQRKKNGSEEKRERG